jgi:hypothetical protein
LLIVVAGAATGVVVKLLIVVAGAATGVTDVFATLESPFENLGTVDGRAL